MPTHNLNKVLATKGNRAVKSSGETVWIKGVGANVAPGEFVVYNPRTNTTLAVSDLETADSIAIGVGVKETRKNKTRMTIRHIAGDVLKLQKGVDTATMTAKAPECSCSQVVDIFPTCVKCDETYSIGVDLDDYLVRGSLGTNDTLRYQFSALANCDDCDDCDETADLTQVLSVLRDKINGKYQTALSERALPRRNDLTDEVYQPFKASLLYTNTFTYSLPFSDGDCDDCQYLDAIGGALIDNETVTFDGTVDPDDNSRSLPYQLQAAVQQLNDELYEIGGSAYLTRSSKPCCAYKLEVNTCDADFELHDHNGAEITPDGGAATNPLTDAITDAADYNSCDASASTSTPTVGLRIFVDAVHWESVGDALSDLRFPIPNTWIRRIGVEPIGDAWEVSGFHQNETCPAERPFGHGLFWMDRELRMTSQGGYGSNYRPGSYNGGLFNAPDEFSKVNNLITDSTQSYCTYSLEVIRQKTTKSTNSHHVVNRNLTSILVPEGDTTTQTSVELYLNKLNQLGYNTEFETCLGVVDDTQNVTVDVEATYDVSSNDTVNVTECDAVTYDIKSQSSNVSAASISGAGVITYTVTSADTYTITYRVYCDGVLIDEATLSGTASV